MSNDTKSSYGIDYYNGDVVFFERGMDGLYKGTIQFTTDRDPDVYVLEDEYGTEHEIGVWNMFDYFSIDALASI